MINTRLLLFLLIIAPLGSRHQAQNIHNDDIQTKVIKLLSSMTLEEKIGQMTQVDFKAFNNLNDISSLFIGSVLWGGGSDVGDNQPYEWSKMSDSLMQLSFKTRLGIPLILGIDAVHGNNNIDGAVIFPHNIGLGCSRNPELVEQIARITAKEVTGTGIHWTFAPCVAVARDDRWGRTYESYSENPELVAKLGAAAIRGLEGGDLTKIDAVLSCTKHFIGDGGTEKGDDQGNTKLNLEQLKKIHLPGYLSAIEENTGSIMASYNSWNGEKLHGQKYLLTDLLKGELGFKGFVVSDWAAIDQLPGDYKSDIEKSINAGIDMVMVPYGELHNENRIFSKRRNTYLEFITYLKELVDENKIPMSRIDDAVSRILTAKFNLNLFNKTKTNEELFNKIGSEEHRKVAKEAVQQSLVLLKNENNILPINKNIGSIMVAGRGADNIGMQCGGWTVAWQGKHGEVISGGTTIFDAVKKTVSKDTELVISEDGEGAENSDLIIAVIGEDPYAEGDGDRENLELSDEDKDLIEEIKETGKPFIVVLLSGRPMILGDLFNDANAVVAAWLPGTEGSGITDVLFGDVNFSGKLSFTWPKNMDQIPINLGDKNYDPLLPYGFGLTYPSDSD